MTIKLVELKENGNGKREIHIPLPVLITICLAFLGWILLANTDTHDKLWNYANAMNKTVAENCLKISSLETAYKEVIPRIENRLNEIANDLKELKKERPSKK